MKDEFVSVVSHELRTPLTSIKGYVDLLVAGGVGSLDELQREFLGIVKENADRLVGLINDLLDISRIESGKVELHRAAVPLQPLVESVVQSLRPQLKAKEQTIRTNVPGDLPPAFCDQARVLQILTNLLSNAHKYTPAGGTIDVCAAHQGAYLRIDVRDDGVGLSPEDQAQLFNKFFRAKNQLAIEVGGTGLGLAITRYLVEMQGGEISVRSALGSGSTFSFTLPLGEPPR
jgi:signal transduction histidine kinase